MVLRAVSHSLFLERYEAQKKAPGAGPAKLAERLEKIRKKRIFAN